MGAPLFMDGRLRENLFRMISGYPHDCGNPQIIHGFSTRTIHGVRYSSIPALVSVSSDFFLYAHLATFFLMKAV